MRSLVLLSDRAMGTILSEGQAEEIIRIDLDGKDRLFLCALYGIQCFLDNRKYFYAVPS